MHYLNEAQDLSAEDVIRLLGLAPHPEGGHYSETFRDTSRARDAADRPASTSIYYLLQRGERPHWHRLDAAEVWHYYAGASLTLRLSVDGQSEITPILGRDMAKGERPQMVVPAGIWQAAESLGAWTLVGCTVAPGFLFETFELAPPGWEPGSD